MKFNLTSYFLNKKLFLSTLPEVYKNQWQQKIKECNDYDDHFKNLMIDDFSMKIAISYINNSNIPTLNELLLKNEIIEGTVFTYDKAFFFKKISSSGIEKRKFHIKLQEYEDLILSGEFSTEHYTCNTALSKLTGKSRVFLLGIISGKEEKNITIRPLIFAEKILVDEVNNIPYPINQCRIFPEQIDQFKNISNINDDNFEILSKIPEKDIKKYFGEILEEKNVTNDWGGEISDLYTTNMIYNGVRKRAAIIFKGPAKFHPMTIQDLGKNGDQIFRLFSESADIYILQHCHHVTSAVEAHMEAFATKNFILRNYVILNGVDTYKILKAYKKI